MKRLLSLVLVMMMLLSTVAMAAEEEASVSEVTPEQIAEMISSKMASLDHREELFDLLMLYKGAGNPDQFFNAYWDTLVLFAGKYDYDISSIKTATKYFIRLISAENGEEQLRDYLGINADGTSNDNPNQEALEAYLLGFVGDVTEMLNQLGYNAQNLQKGVDFLDRTFGLMDKVLAPDGELANDMGYAVPLFVVNQHNDAEIELDVIEVARLVKYMNSVSDRVSVTNSEQAVTQMNKLVNYYNTQDPEDQAAIFAFLTKYGFLKLVDSVQPEAEIITQTKKVTNTKTIVVNNNGEAFTLPTQLIPQSPFPMFTDMVGVSWAQVAVERLFQFGAINGRVMPSFTKDISTIQVLVDGSVVDKNYDTRAFAGEPGLYDPTAFMTRAEFTAIVVRLMGADLVTDASVFTDVVEGDWYKEVIMTAYVNKYLSGDGSTTFEPLRDITREEIAVIVAGILTANNIEVKQEDKNRILTKFMDAADISEWAKDSVELIVSRGIMQGSGTEGEFMAKPTDNATRAEVAVMLYRLAEIVETTVYINPEVTEEETSGE